MQCIKIINVLNLAGWSRMGCSVELEGYCEET